MYEVSVIVPVYNVQEWLPRCIESLIAQSVFSQLEIILVDDGSSDGSGLLCDDYAHRYSNILAFHKENGGVSSARNYGLCSASGKYVAFVDADDYVDSEFYKEMISAGRLHKSDLVVGDYYLAFADGKKHRYRASKIRPCIWDRDSAIIAFLKGENIGVNLFDKLFLRSKIGSLRFDENIKIGEDLYFIFQYLTSINTAYGDFTPGYYYFQRDGSAMKGKFTNKYFDVIEVSERILDWVRVNKPEFMNYAEAMCIYSAYKTLERGYKSNVYDQYSYEIGILSEKVNSFPIYKAWKCLSFKKFIGLVLIKISPHIYIQVCKMMKI